MECMQRTISHTHVSVKFESAVSQNGRQTPDDKKNSLSLFFFVCRDIFLSLAKDCCIIYVVCSYQAVMTIQIEGLFASAQVVFRATALSRQSDTIVLYSSGSTACITFFSFSFQRTDIHSTVGNPSSFCTFICSNRKQSRANFFWVVVLLFSRSFLLFHFFSFCAFYIFFLLSTFVSCFRHKCSQWFYIVWHVGFIVALGLQLSHIS